MLYSSRSRSLSATTDKCCICLNALTLGSPLLTLSCGHKFHFECLTMNIQANNQQCPLCRAQVDASVIHLLAKTSKRRRNKLPMVLSSLPRLPVNVSLDMDLPEPQTNLDGLLMTEEETHMPSLRRYRQNYRNLSPTLNVEEHMNDLTVEFCSDRVTPARQAATSSSTATNNPQSITVSTTLEYQAQPSNEESTIVGLITLEACCPVTSSIGSSFTSSHESIDLVCVVDQSGSMSGAKMILLKNTLIDIVQKMNEFDRLAIIAFNTTAHNISYGLQRMTKQKQARLATAIRAYICARGNTYIGCGLSMGINMLKNRKTKNPLAALLLLTDGQDNQTHDYSRLIKTLPEDVSCYTFGYGPDHNSLLLMDLAKQGNEGSFTYIDRKEALASAFAIVLSGLFSCVAQQLRIDIKFGGQYLITDICSNYRYEPEHLPSAAVSTFLNDLNTGEKRNLVFKLLVPKIYDSNSTNSNASVYSTSVNNRTRNSLTPINEFNRESLSRNVTFSRTRENIRYAQLRRQNSVGEQAVSTHQLPDEQQLSDDATIGYVSLTYWDLKSRRTVTTTRIPFRLIRTLSPSADLLQVNHTVDIQRNRVETARALEQSMAENDYQKSRAILNEQVKKVQISASANDHFCQNLIEDIKYQHSSEQNYRLSHRASSAVHHSERASYISNATRSALVYLSADQRRVVVDDKHMLTPSTLFV